MYDEIAQSSYFTIEAQLLIREPLEIKIIIKKTILILIMHPTKDLVGCVIQYKISTFRQLNLLTQIYTRKIIKIYRTIAKLGLFWLTAFGILIEIHKSKKHKIRLQHRI